MLDGWRPVYEPGRLRPVVFGQQSSSASRLRPIHFRPPSSSASRLRPTSSSASHFRPVTFGQRRRRPVTSVFGCVLDDFLGRTTNTSGTNTSWVFHRASQTYTRPPHEPGDMIRARLGLGRTLPAREPGDIIRARLGLDEHFLTF